MWMSCGSRNPAADCNTRESQPIFPDSNQDSTTHLYVIDSDSVVALGKTRSLLKSDQLQSYSAETALTYTT